jgi:hypothetical protein
MWYYGDAGTAAPRLTFRKTFVRHGFRCSGSQVEYNATASDSMALASSIFTKGEQALSW